MLLRRILPWMGAGCAWGLTWGWAFGATAGKDGDVRWFGFLLPVLLLAYTVVIAVFRKMRWHKVRLLVYGIGYAACCAGLIDREIEEMAGVLYWFIPVAFGGMILLAEILSRGVFGFKKP